jgi:hypothetical protein
VLFIVHQVSSVLSRQQNAEQNHNVLSANKSFENVANVKYFGSSVTNQTRIRETIKWKPNSGNVFYLSVQNLLSSGLLFKNFNLKI